jgi:hypothetical protein
VTNASQGARVPCMSRDEFIDEFLMTLEREGLREPKVRVELSTPSGDAVSFDLIRLDPSVRGQGVGRRVLKLLLRLSDESAIPLEVIPRCVEHEGLGDKALEDWYLRNDFVLATTRETPRLMRRAPRPLSACPSTA